MESSDSAGHKQFRQALDALPAAVYITDAQGRLTYFNAAAINFSGRIPAVGSDSWCVSWKLFRPDGTPLPHDQCPMAVALKEGRSIYGEEAIVERPDGTRRWFQPFPTPLRDAEGRVVGGINMLIDITDRKRQEQTSSLLAAIVDSSDDAIVSKNLDGIITSWNQSAERIFGYSAAEAIGQHITLIIPSDRLEEEKRIIAKLKSGEKIDHFDTIRRRKDGSLVDVSLTISPVRDAASRVIGASKVARDISERKTTEHTLSLAGREQNALFHLADGLHRARSLPEVCDCAMSAICEAVDCDRTAILLLDSDGVMRFVAWRDLSDHYRESVEGHSPWNVEEQNPQIVSLPDIKVGSLGDALERVVRAEGIGALAFIPLVSQNKLIGKFMTYYPAPHCFTPKELDLCTTIARQLSFAIERKRAEEELRSSEERFRLLSESLDNEVQARTEQLEQRNAELLRQSRYVRNLSRRLLMAQDEERRHIARELHDSAGQTLTVLGMNFAQILEKAKLLDPQLAELAEASEQMVQQLHQEIRTTSYLLHPPLLDENGLASALAWYTQGLSDRSGTTIQLEVTENFGRLPRETELVVFRLIQECLTNIHRHANAKMAIVRLSRQGDKVLVDVEDDGKGMSPQKLVEVQSGGSGVGIRGMRERVRQLQGEMEVSSDSSGTKVKANIPVQDTAEPSAESRQQSAA